MIVVEGDSKAPILIPTAPRSREAANSILGLIHLTLDTYLIMLSDKQIGIK